jgi:hypothetical protein
MQDLGQPPKEIVGDMVCYIFERFNYITMYKMHF